MVIAIVIFCVLAVAALLLAFMAMGTAQTAASAALAAGAAAAEASGAVLQAQCLTFLVALLALPVGAAIGVFLYRRIQAAEQKKLAIYQAQMRAMQQPRQFNGRWTRRQIGSQAMRPNEYPMLQPGQGNYPAPVHMPYPLMVGQPMPIMYYPPQMPARPADPMIIEVSNSDDQVDLSSWGF